MVAQIFVYFLIAIIFVVLVEAAYKIFKKK